MLLSCYPVSRQVAITDVTAPVTISLGATLTLSGVSGVGVDMSTAAQDLTITGSGTINLGASQIWDVGSGRTLTIGSTVVTSSSALTKSGGGVLVLARTTSYSGGTVIGTVGLAKTTGGTVTLSGLNTYTGGTTIFAGVLGLGTTDTLLTTGSLSVSGGTLDLGDNSQTLAAVTLASGTISNGLLTSASDFDVRSGSVSAALAGAVGLMKTTGSTVTLSGANTYTNLTTVGAGTLALGASGTINAGNNLLLTGGALDLNGFSQTLGTVTLASGTITGSGTLTGTGAFSVESGTVGAVLAGTAGLTKTASGTVTLAAQNAYSGGTFVRGGTLELSTNDALSSGTSLTVDGGELAAGLTNQALGSVSLTSGTISGIGNISGTAFTVADGLVTVSLSGTGALTKTDSGTVTLSGVNSFTGGTNVLAGTLALGASNTLLTTGTVSINGGSLNLGSYNQTVANATLAGGGSIAGTGALSSGGFFSLQSGAVSAALAGTAAVSKTTTGSVTLSGANTYAGGTTVSSGTLALSGSGTLGAITASLTISGGAVDLGSTTQTVSALALSSGTLTGGILYSDTAFTLTSGTVNTVLAGAGTVDKEGLLTTVTLSALNTYLGGTIVNGGTLKLAGVGTSNLGSDTGNVTVSNGVLDLGGNNLLANTVSISSGGSVINGTLNATSVVSMTNGTNGADLSGTAVLTGNNTYTGLTVISQGTLQIGDGGTSGSLGNSGVVNNASLAFNRSNGYSFGQTISGTGSVTQMGSGTTTLSGANTFTGGTTVNGGTLVAGSATALGAPGGTVTVNGGELQAGGQFLNYNFAGTGGQITATSNLIMGSFTSTAAFVYGGTLNVGSRAVQLLSPGLSTVKNITLAEGGQLSSFYGISLQVGGSLVATGNATVNGPFKNPSQLVFTPTPHFEVATVQGPTASGKNLTFAGPVSGGGTLLGNIRILDSYTPSNSPDAQIQVGNGVITTSVTLGHSAITTLQIGGTLLPGISYDQYVINSLGTLNLDGTLKLQLIVDPLAPLDPIFSPASGNSFNLLNHNGGSIVGTFASIDTSLAVLLPGLSWDFSNLYTTGFADVVGVAVPEPAAWATIFGVVALGFAAVRRRTKSKANARDENS